MGDPLDSAQDLSIELQQLRRSALELQRELPSQKSKDAGLSASVAHFTALSHTLHVGLLFEDAARRITFANDTFCALFGVAGPDYLIGLEGRQATELIHRACVDLVRFLAQIDRAVTGQRTVTGEEISLADGRWLEWDYAPVMVDGICAGYVWSYRDITLHKQALMTLSESDARFRTMADTAPVLIWEAGLDKRCTYFNQVWLDYAGRTLEQEQGNGWAKGVHQDDFSRCLTTYEEAFDRREPFQMEYRLRKANGEYGWLLDTGTPRWLPSGEFAGYIGSCIDITERKRIETAHDELLARLKKISSQVPSVVYQFQLRPDGSSCFPYASEHIREIYRVSPEEVREDASKVFAIFHPEDYDGIVASITKSAETMQPWQYEYRVKFPDGAVRWLFGNSVPQKETDGSTLWHGFITDITTRKQTKSALHESETRLRQMTENIREVFWLTDPSKNQMVYISRAYEQIWGRTPESLYQSPHSWLDAIHAEDRERILQAALTKQVEGTYDEEYRILKPDGSVRWIHDRAFPVLDNSGVIRRIAGLAEDITEQKQIEESLRNSEELFRTFLDHAPNAMFMKTTDGRYSFTNQHFKQLCHSDRAQLVGKTDAELFPRDLADQYRANDRLVLETGQAREFEETNGLQTSIAMKFPVYDRTGQIYALGGIVTDITERKQAEALLQVQKQVLELVASDAPLRETLDTLVRLTEAQSDGMLGSILLLDKEGLHLSHGASPSLPEEYTGAIDGSAIGPSAGSCGTAAFRRKLVIVEDIATDPLWDNYRHLALPHGLRACWSSPIASKYTSVLGTFALYYREPRRPSPHELRLIESVTRLAAIAIDREQADQALRRSYEERERIGHDLHDSVLQSLYAIGLGLEATKPSMTPATVKRLDGSITQLNALIQEVRGFITHMAVPAEDVQDIAQRLQALVGAFTATGAGNITIRLDPSFAKAFSAEQNSHLLNIIKEALSNSIRHAHAAHRSVLLGRFRGRIRLEIRDDGVGFHMRQRREGGMGLSTMRARAKKLGGRLSIISRPGGGTRVRCLLPLP